MAVTEDTRLSLEGFDTAKEYTILVYAAAGQDNISEFTEVTVETWKEVSVSISVAQKSRELKAGEVYVIKASAVPSDVHLIYRSLNDKIAAVDQNGKVTAIAEGETDITITCREDAKASATVHITVIKPGSSGSVPALNSKLEDANLEYRVTKSDAVNGTVTVSGVKAAGRKKSTITIPATVSKNNYTFKVTAIDKNVFKSCKKKLKSVIIGANVNEIGANCFQKCTKLKSIRFMGTIAPKKVGKNAFKRIKSNCKIYYSKNMRKSELKKLKSKMKSAGKKVIYKKK